MISRRITVDKQSKLSFTVVFVIIFLAFLVLSASQQPALQFSTHVPQSLIYMNKKQEECDRDCNGTFVYMGL